MEFCYLENLIISKFGLFLKKKCNFRAFKWFTWKLIYFNLTNSEKASDSIDSLPISAIKSKTKSHLQMGFRSSNFWLKSHLSLYFIKFDCHLASLRITLKRTPITDETSNKFKWKCIVETSKFQFGWYFKLVVYSQITILDTARSHYLKSVFILHIQRNFCQNEHLCTVYWPISLRPTPLSLSTLSSVVFKMASSTIFSLDPTIDLIELQWLLC